MRGTLLMRPTLALSPDAGKEYGRLSLTNATGKPVQGIQIDKVIS